MVSQVEGGGVLLKQVMLAKALQPENAAFPIEPMPSGKSMLARAEQSQNAQNPIEVTPSGMLMLVSAVQSANG